MNFNIENYVLTNMTIASIFYSEMNHLKLLRTFLAVILKGITSFF